MQWWNLCQSLVLGTCVLCLCCLPSCVLTPVNVIVRYLACVVIYPNVRLTWAGLAACVPDYKVLLEMRVYMSVIVLYCVVWCLWPGRDKVCRVLKPPLGKVKKSYSDWKNFVEYSWGYIYCTWYQNGPNGWNDVPNTFRLTQLWETRLNTSMIMRVIGIPWPVFQISKWTSYRLKIPGLHVIGSVYRCVNYVHVKVRVVIWRVTSHHIKLHVNLWLYVAEWMCQKFVTDPGLYLVGTHQDVLQKNMAKFLLYRSLPLGAVSRLWGRVNNPHLPVWLRTPVYRLYIRVYGCKLEESLITDLKQYKNLSEFFRRSLKPGIRPVDRAHCLTSPADGKVLHVSNITKGAIEQIKGVTYSLSAFVGEDTTFMQHFGRDVTLYNTDTCKDEDCNPSQHAQVLLKTVYEQQTNQPLLYSTTLNKNSLFSHHNLNDIDYHKITFELEESSNNFLHLPAISADIALNENVFQIGSLTNEQSTTCIPYANIANEEEKLFDPKEHHEQIMQHKLHTCHELSFAKSLLVNPGHVLHQCTIYLAPGDYHRFHSPVDWTVYYRRHFSGNLYSVNPWVAGWLQGLFTLNERALYVGRWKYGLFSFTAVGATNVGSINVFFDKGLKTNQGQKLNSPYTEKHFKSKDQKGVSLQRGQLMGDFNFGSTICLLFEAPPDFTLRVKGGDIVKYGQGLLQNPNNGSRKQYLQKQSRHKKKTKL